MEVTRARYKYKPDRSKRLWKRFLLALAALFVLGSAGGYTVLATSKPVGALTAETTSIQMATPEAIAISWPQLGQAAVGSLRDGVLAVTPNEQQKPIASITKLITALAVLEKLPLEPGQAGPVFTIGQTDIANYRMYVAKSGSVMPINLGQTITEYDALTGLLLPSGNNMADSLVTWVFGSMEAYLAYANAMLDRLGLARTDVADASGFSPGSVSTPSDLILLGQKVLQHPVLSEISAKRSATVPGSGELRNTNILLGDEHAIGLKTGNTDEAGNCLLYAYRFGPGLKHTYIGVVLDQPSYFGMFGTARALKDSALENFRTIEVLPAGTVVGGYKTAWGVESAAVTVDSVRIYGWVGKRYEVRVGLEELSLPSVASQVVGQARIEGYDDAHSDVISRAPLALPSLWWRLTNY